MKHVTVFRQAGRFAGWPANYGIWSWGNEIVAGFTLGYLGPAAAGFHARDTTRPFMPMQARSLDGGETWQSQPTPCRTPGNRGFSADEHMQPELRVGAALAGVNAPSPHPGGIDFRHPGFALMCARSGLGAGTRAWFYTSQNRCRRWRGPFSLPLFGAAGVEARSDYIVSGPAACLLFLTASRDSGPEGRGVFCARTSDGGQTFSFVSWVCEIPEGEGWAIMPASVRLGSGRILTAVRRRGEQAEQSRAPCWIDLYGSDDDGESWRFAARPVADTGTGGNPPTLTLLHDGRLCITYTYRSAPHELRAVLSSDGGKTWGDERVLRSGAGSHDIGYPRTVQRPDGTLVTVYYWTDTADGERYIAATLWQP